MTLAFISWLLLASTAQAEIDYAREVQPILARKCFSCHGPDQAESGIAFHQADLALAEADSGDFAIVPGDVEGSGMITRILTDDEYEQMPPEGERLRASEIAILKQWIDEGATFSRHWAFEPLSNPPVPQLSENSRNTANLTTASDDLHPIDAFVFSRLDEAGLKQAPPADKRTLIRRATYDLTGLPPTPQQVEEFIADTDPHAYENLIDRLLASHHYGERWGRHWLDLVRYAETNSFERDAAKPNAWKYRDYVIRSFNEDKPYDQFVQEQLAGDLFEHPTTESLTATGYYRLGIWDDEPADPLQARYDELDDLITTTGQAFLGLTINCARCHDHKIDPIPTTDYYGMLAFFADMTPYASRSDLVGNNQVDVSSPQLIEQYRQCDVDLARINSERIELEQAGIVHMSASDQRATEGNARDRKRVLSEKLDQHLTDEQRLRYAQLEAELKLVNKRRRQLPPREQVLGIARKRKIANTFVMYRGNPHSPTETVSPHVPEIFEENLPPIDDDQRRLELARWMTTPSNRLTTRVIVNRIWQHHFGRGIVRSANNFGQLGTPPTHPQLLDYLAGVFVDNGWKIKAMHRLIMTSRTYKAAAALTPEQTTMVGDTATIDPGNDLFWRFDPRRLAAEEVRDSILAVVGTLNREPYGPSFYEALSPEVLAGQSRPGKGWGQSNESQRNRRSVYIHVKRSLLTPLLSAFDFPEPDTTCEARFATLQPGQAMSLLNSDFIHEKANQLASSIRAEISSRPESDTRVNDNMPAFIKGVIHRVLARKATDEEIADGVELIEELITRHAMPRQRAEALYALSVLNWNEFVFVF
ncbi:PSD1 and planctomycete cytochrome C domain-containing protein [Rhodopirellula sp. ICT_H3.1]|uniref:PSD1 and planctomycete cytochrome C domain-containing protein n=1 Tax=Aporhodopirellula aestuarii TaxID=2950107 RepID=A0ABT0U7U2_9BACT|nr:PSD1 and planctomycete cytochrome C domain-containing protein [Aporhodopirellula aestuarii]MCM2373009.1 PSD1 and planctomycete cytochrome C domain-containing protein [Aporhodopirellula aestuarii]